MATTLASPGDWPFVMLPNMHVWGDVVPNNRMTLGVLVDNNERNTWNSYSQTNAPVWMEQLPLDDVSSYASQVTPFIWRHGAGSDENSYIDKDQESGQDTQYAVSWQSTPPLLPERVNHNDLDNPFFQQLFNQITGENGRQVQVVSELVPAQNGSYAIQILQPIMDSLTGDDMSTIVGYFHTSIPYQYFLYDVVLPSRMSDLNGVIYAVLATSNCPEQQPITLDLNNGDVLGLGDQHEQKFDSFREDFDLELPADTTVGCQYSVTLYPSSSLESTYVDGSESMKYVGIGIAIIACFVLAFVMYDCCVRKHERKLIKSAHKNTSIVNSLFPENVRDRMMKQQSKAIRAQAEKDSKGMVMKGRRGRRRNRKRPFMVQQSEYLSRISNTAPSCESNNVGKQHSAMRKEVCDRFA